MRLLAWDIWGGWIESSAVSSLLSTDVSTSSDTARDYKSAEATERHPANDEQQEQLQRHERHAGKPDRIGKRAAVPGADGGERPEEQHDRDQRAGAPLDKAFGNERPADIGERRPDELHDFNFVAPRQGGQADDIRN